MQTSYYISMLLIGICQAFTHPGLLHTATDLARVVSKVSAKAEPWLTGWEKLIDNSHAQASYQNRATSSIYRGSDGTHSENYPVLYNDIAAAYQLAVRYSVSSNTSFADTAVDILNAWAGNLTYIGGSSDKYLAAGLYGYQFANAAELMRDYNGWESDDFDSFVSLMTTVFYPMNHDFLVNHNGAEIDHYWSNWDLCNIASVMSIGILSDNTTMFDEAITYFESGAGNGAIGNAIWKIYDDVDGETLGQLQESGRDQGHAMLATGLLSVIGQTSYNQGRDMFGYDSNRILAGAEYAAKYNLGYDVPYTTYNNSDDVNQTVISSDERGDIRPIWELIYNHYGVVKSENVTWSKAMRDFEVANTTGAEGGGGDYASTSGGYDFLGFGTLMYTQ